MVFAFGSKPTLSRDQAIELADVLATRRNLAAASLSHDIRLEASFAPDAQHATKEIDPTANELGELVAVLQEPRWPKDEPAYESLLREALQAPGRGTI